mmetsp:Transcript_7002/g.22136  ORF Transcript_7002/g.22136 Transcript_7002/m.22136 type:complete len:223 (+) Transcript_7002:162-830(+)
MWQGQLRLEAAVDEPPRHRGVGLRPEGLSAPLTKPLARGRGRMLQRPRQERGGGVGARRIRGSGLLARRGGEHPLNVRGPPEDCEGGGATGPGRAHAQELRDLRLRESQLLCQTPGKLLAVLLQMPRRQVVELHHVRVRHAERAQLLLRDARSRPLGRSQRHGAAEGAEVGLRHCRQRCVAMHGVSQGQASPCPAKPHAQQRPARALADVRLQRDGGRVAGQ